MKLSLRLLALTMLFWIAHASLSLSPEEAEQRKAEQAEAVKAEQAHALFDRQTKYPRLTMALNEIMGQRKQAQTMSNRTEVISYTADGKPDERRSLTNAEVFLNAHRPKLNALTQGSSITFGKNPDFYVQLQNQMAPLDEDFRIILENFKKIGCFEDTSRPLDIDNLSMDPIKMREQKDRKDRNPFSLCEPDLANDLLIPLGDTSKHGTDVFDHFNTHVYQPLSYKVFPNRFSFADTLQDLLNLDKDSLMIKGDLPIPDFNTFEKMILGGFAEISNYAIDFEANRDLISKVIMDILKQFHIFWNVKRQKNEIESTKVNTYSILNSIIKQHRTHSASMKATTILLLNAIRDGYFRFTKADRTLKFIQSNTQDILGYNVLKRYDNFIQTILGGGFFAFFYVFELGCIIEILTTYILLDVSAGRTDPDAYGRFYNRVSLKIEAMYNVYAKWLVETQSKYFDLITEVTATILLKMQHRGAVVVSLTSMLGFTQAPSFVFRSSKHSTTTTFFELFDYWMLIPDSCKNYVDLQTCTIGLGNDFLWRVRQNNFLQYSVTGMNLFVFLKGIFMRLVEGIALRNGFGHFESFKNMYYAELFRASENIRVIYKINDMTFLNRLQNKLGQVVEKKKADENLDPELIKMLGRLDDNMYNFFLQLRDKLNKESTNTMEIALLDELEVEAKEFINQFKIDNFESKDPKVSGIFPLMEELIHGWVFFMKKQGTINLVDSEANSPGSQFTPLPVQNSITYENIIKEPQLDTSAASPVFFSTTNGVSRKVVR